jgi:hypothetical protein
MSLAVRMAVEPLRSLAFGSIGATYMGVGTAIDNRARMVYISNLTDAKLFLSFDGVADHFPLPVYGFVLLDVCQNRSESDYSAIAVGERLYAKQLDVPTKGSIYMTVFYGKET